MEKIKDFLFSKKVRDAILISLFIFFTEMIVRLVTSNSLSFAVLRIFISSIILGFLISLISSYFKKNISKIIKIVICFFITFYIFVQTGLYNYLGFYMGIGNGEQGTKNFSYIIDFLKSIKMSYYLILIPFVLLIIYYLIIEKKIIKDDGSRKFDIKKLVVYLLSVLVLSGLYYSTLVIPFMQNKYESIDNRSLFLYPENSNLSVSQFGVLVYGITDINSLLFDIGIEDVDSFDNIDINKEDEVVTDYSRIINDDAWIDLISDEKNSTYNNLNNYFINRDITSKNEYTGIFKDKNLIVILLESTNEIALEKEFFPNIWKIYSEGISFRNNYSPRNNCSTGNNEMTVMTGLYSINNTCTANKYKNNEYYQAIFNVFKNSGYNVTSYHDYTDKYYSRHTIHKNMGSDKFYGVVDLGMEYSKVYEEWPSDLEFFKTAMPYFINQDKFMAFMTTVTTHQTYNVPSTMGDKHLDLFKDTDYSKTTKRYLSKMYELDQALGYMLEELERNGKLENTVIAMFSDHYPYGLTNAQINSVLDYDVNVRQEVDRTPMVIYNSKFGSKEIYKYTSLVDLLPTLLNMFDMDYDPRLYMGTDIMSNNIGRVIFADSSWQDSVGFYSATNGKFVITNDEGKSYTIEELKEINKEVSIEKKMSNLAIKNNYFKYLKNGLNKYEVIDDNLNIE